MIPHELQEMRRMLAEHGFDPAGALRLVREGIGPEELKERLKIPATEMGGLTYTHNIEQLHHSRPDKKWIQKALRYHKPGALHRQLGVPVGEKIPLSTLRRASHKKGKVGRRARLAITLRKISKRPKRGKR